MKSYYKLMLGKGSIYAEDCFKGNFIGADYGIYEDLSSNLTDNWRAFIDQFIPIFLANRPGKTKIAAGLACRALHTIAKGIQNEDIVICPNGTGGYRVGEISGYYYYKAGEILPHRRPVKWHGRIIEKSEMSEDLISSFRTFNTVSNMSKHVAELDNLIFGNQPAQLISTDDTIEDPSEFAIEKHLEDFLVKNWAKTELGKKYYIYEEDGELVGQQYPSDTGSIDILAISKDKKEILVVELKKGRASDHVVGQIQRYMGYVLEELAEKDQTVRGVIIAHEDDIRIRRALAVTNNIEFYRYQVSFKLFKS